MLLCKPLDLLKMSCNWALWLWVYSSPTRTDFSTRIPKHILFSIFHFQNNIHAHLFLICPIFFYALLTADEVIKLRFSIILYIKFPFGFLDFEGKKGCRGYLWKINLSKIWRKIKNAKIFFKNVWFLLNILQEVKLLIPWPSPLVYVTQMIQQMLLKQL